MKTIIVFALLVIAFASCKTSLEYATCTSKCSTDLAPKLTTISDQNAQDYATWQSCTTDYYNKKNCVIFSSWNSYNASSTVDVPEYSSAEIVGCAKDCTKQLKGGDFTSYGNCVTACSAFVLKISLAILSILAFFF